jgi:hypothetical protein
VNIKVLLATIAIFTVAVVSTGCINEPRPNDNSADNIQMWRVIDAQRDMQNNTTILVIKSVNGKSNPTSFKLENAAIIKSKTKYGVNSFFYFTDSTNGAPKPGGSKLVFMSFATNENLSDAYLTIRGTEYDHTANTAVPSQVNVSLANVPVDNTSLTVTSIMDMSFNVSQYL